MRVKLLIAFHLLFVNSQASAERENNGGRGVKCHDSRGSVISVEVVDLWEAEREFGLELKRTANEPGPYGRALLTRLVKAAPDYWQQVYDEYDYVIRNYEFLDPDARLVDVPDHDPIIAPHEDCHLVQLANYSRNRRILFDEKLWNWLLPTSRTALFLHEALYKVIRTHSNTPDSRKAREIVGHLLSWLDTEEFTSWYQRRFPSDLKKAQFPVQFGVFARIDATHIYVHEEGTVLNPDPRLSARVLSRDGCFRAPILSSHWRCRDPDNPNRCLVNSKTVLNRIGNNIFEVLGKDPWYGLVPGTFLQVAPRLSDLQEYVNCDSLQLRAGYDFTTNTFSESESWIGMVLNARNFAIEFDDSDPDVKFDFDGDGKKDWVKWPVTPETYFLVLDRNQNGRVDGATDFLGSYAKGPLGLKEFANGVELLRQWDGNRDGQIDPRDGIYHMLRLWRDLNRNGQSEPSELFGLAIFDIKFIDLEYQPFDSSNRYHLGTKIRLERWYGSTIYGYSFGMD